MVEKTRKQPRYSSAAEWMDLVCHTIEHDSVIKRSEVLLHAVTWMDLENSLLKGKKNKEQKEYYRSLLKVKGPE